MRAVAALMLVTMLVLAPPARGADDHDELRVLEQAGRTLLHEQLLAEVARQSAARRLELAADLASVDALVARRERLRAQLAQMLGDLPERTPLHARTVGTIACAGYRIEKVLYESRPGHHVTANLYLPEGAKGPVPGVLVPCGHSDNGKASGPYQSVCILLALNGCAALIYDPIGQGERNQIAELKRHGTHEHTLVGPAALLVGWNTANYRVWDGLRSMDYLANRPEVDPARLGCTGNSGGGTMTTWLMAVDERIVAAAPSCFITTIERLFNTIGPQDCEQHFPAQGRFGIDHADFITMRAPKPTLILAAERDFFDIGGTRTAYADAQNVYSVWGEPRRVGLFSYDDEHGFSQPRRQAAVAWMRRWLADDERPVREPELSLQPDDALNVTKTGQVLNEFDDEVTVVEMAKDRARQLAQSRTAQWNSLDTDGRRALMKKTLGMRDETRRADRVGRLGKIARDGYSIEKLVIERNDEVPLPALLFVPGGANKGKKLSAVLYADGRGKATDAQAGGAIEALVRQGHVVLAPDLRGYGETADLDKVIRYANDEFRTAMIAMHLGRPLVGQRVEDLLAALDVLAGLDEVDASSMQLIGIDRAGPVALHAAALDERIARLTLRNSIRSWTADVVDKPTGANLLGYVVPGVLEHYELSDLEAMLGERFSVDAHSAPLGNCGQMARDRVALDAVEVCAAAGGDLIAEVGQVAGVGADPVFVESERAVALGV